MQTGSNNWIRERGDLPWHSAHPLRGPCTTLLLRRIWCNHRTCTYSLLHACGTNQTYWQGSCSLRFCIRSDHRVYSTAQTFAQPWCTRPDYMASCCRLRGQRTVHQPGHSYDNRSRACTCTLHRAFHIVRVAVRGFCSPQSYMASCYCHCVDCDD